MKIFVLSLTVLLCSVTIYAQDKLAFTYDTSGNQITRQRICINCTPAARSALVESDSINLIADELKNISNFQLRSYPNPVADELHVEWINNPEMLVYKIQLFSNNSQLLLDMSINDKQGEQTLNFGTFPAGIYHLIVHYNDQRTKSFKIVKK